jgi:transposase-like protein
MPPRFQRPYPPEFRREAVRLVEATGRPYREIARELGVTRSGFFEWQRSPRDTAGSDSRRSRLTRPRS